MNQSESLEYDPEAKEPDSRFAAAAISMDHLLECLVFLTHHHGRPRTGDVLKAGLPTIGAQLSPDMFLRSAERAGFKARLVQRPLSEIPKSVLPAVLTLKDRKACVLVNLLSESEALVMFPETKGYVEKIELAELEKLYTGFVIFLQPEFGIDAHRTVEDVPRAASWFWGTIFRNWWSYAQVGLAAIMINLFALLSPMFIMMVYDRVIPNNAFETLYVLATGIVIVLIFDFILKTLRGYFIDAAGKRTDVILACQIFDQVLDMRLSARPASAGAFANTLREFETLRDFFTSATLAAFIDLPFALLFIFVIWLISGPVALVLLVVVPVVLLYGFLIQIPLNAVVKKNFKEAERKHGVLVETINGLETIKSTGSESRMRHLWEGLVGLTASSSQKARFYSLSATNFTALCQQLATVGVMVYGVSLISEGEMTVGALFAAVMLGGRAIAPIAQVAQLLTRLQQSKSSLNALDEIMKAPVERPPSKTFLHRPGFSGAIEFKDVSFSYPGREEKVIKNLNLSIGAGEHVGFIGGVGSGKTTISKLIMGLYEADEGAVLIDGTDIRQIDPVDLRRSIGYVPQDPFLFSGTVRDNISSAALHIDDVNVLRAARMAGVDNFVKKSPLGYDLPVGERGDGLSGGQRQSVTIARALLLEPLMLILDEPTSSLDSRSEIALKNQLSNAFSGKTMVLVTHRASLLSLVDRVIVFDSGYVVADGPRDSIIESLAKGHVTTAKK